MARLQNGIWRVSSTIWRRGDTRHGSDVWKSRRRKAARSREERSSWRTGRGSPRGTVSAPRVKRRSSMRAISMQLTQNSAPIIPGELIS